MTRIRQHLATAWAILTGSYNAYIEARKARQANEQLRQQRLRDLEAARLRLADQILGYTNRALLSMAEDNVTMLYDMYSDMPEAQPIYTELMDLIEGQAFLIDHAYTSYA